MMNQESFFPVSRRTASVFILSCLVCLSGTLKVSGQYPGINDSINKYRKGVLVIKAKPGSVVEIEQVSHEFWFGCAISSGFAGKWMPADIKKIYAEKFLENFNSAVTENAVKWPSMEKEKGKISYDEVDSILGWTERNHIPLRAHNLFWGIPKFVQPWVKEMSDDELRKTIQNRAETITARYKGRFAEYDLNNEMVHGNYYEDRLGQDITKQMAQWAHDGDPSAKLFLNDYDILTGVKLKEYLAQIRRFLAQGVPVAGIGVQGHLHSDTFDRQQLRAALDSLAQFRLPIRVTEFNMPGQRSKYLVDTKLKMTPEEEKQNAKEISDYYRICFSHPAVEGIIMWGFWAGANWIPASSMYTTDWNLSETGKAYKSLVFKEWWTKTTGTTAQNGTYSVPAFFGKYRITAGGITREVSLSKSKGTEVVDFTK
jgi:endo-1,4-beta-xylanase